MGDKGTKAMKGDKDKSIESKRMRKRAQEKLRNERLRSGELSAEEAPKAVEELRVQQIELEKQNEELRRAQVNLEASRSRYADLYDFAPVGYFIFDRKGLILDLNLTGATLLGLEKGHLVKKPFDLFIARQDQDRFYLHLKEVFEDLAPVGKMQMILGERVAHCGWRLQRAARHETVEEQVSVETIDYDDSLDPTQSVG